MKFSEMLEGWAGDIKTNGKDFDLTEDCKDDLDDYGETETPNHVQSLFFRVGEIIDNRQTQAQCDGIISRILCWLGIIEA
jgi:hypothetical protein